jgi:tetratricopeptide (TPR) repeat protein
MRASGGTCAPRLIAIAENDADLATRSLAIGTPSGTSRVNSPSHGVVLARTVLRRVVARALHDRQSASIHALCHGDIPEALRMSELAQQIATDSGSPEEIVRSLDSLGTVLSDQGKLAEAAAIFEREGALLHDLDLGWLLACVYFRLAGLRLEDGDDLRAEAICVDALRALGPHGNLWIRLRIERVLGRVALARGDYDSAVARLEFALDGTRQLGDIQGQTYALLDLARAAQERRQLAPARHWLREALAITRLDTEPLRLSRVLEAAAALLASARPEGCLQIVTAAERLRARMGAHHWPLERLQVERTLRLRAVG